MEGILFDVAAKGTIVLLFAAALALVFRRASAAVRHLVWSVGLTSLVALPVLSVLGPRWDLPVLPAVSAPAEAAGSIATAPSGMPWGAVVVAAWLAGALLVGGSIVLGRVRVWWWARGATRLEDPAWTRLAAETADRMGVSRPIEIRRARRSVMPMVWGHLRPVVLVPCDAVHWPAGLRRSVLLHELAHVRRHDVLTQLLGRVACALHWYNPLAWLAARRLRVERERACDDHVLHAGAHPCDYADALVSVARSLRPGRGLLAVGMADSGQFGERIAALLDAGRRRAIVTRRQVVPACLAAAFVVAPLAALRPAPAPEAPSARRFATVATPAATLERREPPPPVPTPAANARPTRREAPEARPAPERESAERESPEGESPARGLRDAPVTPRRAMEAIPTREIVIEARGSAAPQRTPVAISTGRTLDRGRYAVTVRLNGDAATSSCEESPAVRIEPVKHASAPLVESTS